MRRIIGGRTACVLYVNKDGGTIHYDCVCTLCSDGITSHIPQMVYPNLTNSVKKMTDNIIFLLAMSGQVYL